MKKRENYTDDLKEKETSNDPHHPNSLRHCDNASRTEKQVTRKENFRPASNLMKDPHDPDHLRNLDTDRAKTAAKEKAAEAEEEVVELEVEEAEVSETESDSTSRVPSHDPHDPKFPRNRY